MDTPRQAKTATASATRIVRGLSLAVLSLIPLACTSVPGETTASRLQQREVRDRLLGMARSADPQCRNPQVGTTEIIDVHRDGRASEELWTIEQCGRRLRYVVSFPLKPGGPHHFSVREER